MHMPITELNTFKDLNKNIIQSFVNINSIPKKLEAKIKRITNKYKNNIYSGLLFKLTNIYFDPKESKKLWFDILKHKEYLTKKIERDIDIEVAILDYFVECKNDIIDNPLIIEEKIFEAIKKRVLIDELTGLYNYRYYKQRIKEEISKSKRYNAPFSIVMIDIDDFKKYNDNYGHMEGNIVLKKIANLLKKLLRSTDVIIRFGGEEFLIILPQISKKQALLVAEKLRKNISELKFKRKITISGGVATYLDDTQGTDNQLLNLADLALYRAKYEGKNRICNYPKERRTFKRISLDEKIKVTIINCTNDNNKNDSKKIRNISNGGISLFQKKRLKEGDSVHCELLKNKKTFPFNGQVVWVEKIEIDLWEIGIKFKNVSKKQITNFGL